MQKSFIVIICLIAFLVISCDNNVRKEYYSNGKIKSVVNYSKGELTDSISYYPNGQREAILHFKGNKYYGALMMYYSNGNPQIIANYKLGKLDGELKYYFLNGKIAGHFFYLNDTIVYRKRFDSTGKVIDESIPPQIKTENDTIKMGGYFNAVIKFYGPTITEQSILYGGFRKEGQTRMTLDPIDTLKNMQFKLHWKPNSPGRYYFDGIVRMLISNSDSIDRISFSRLVWVKK